MTNFKYNEKALLEEFSKYVDSTYGQHYVGEDNVQSLDIIFSSGNGIGFTVGNIQKYSARYGKKKGWNRDDLVKAMHYCLLAIYRHDIEHKAPDVSKLQQMVQPLDRVKINSVNEKGEITGVTITSPMLNPLHTNEGDLLPKKNLKYWYVVDKQTNKKVPDTYCFKTMSDAQGYHHSMREGTKLDLRTTEEE
jgi:hypothetical protein